MQPASEPELQEPHAEAQLDGPSVGTCGILFLNCISGSSFPAVSALHTDSAEMVAKRFLPKWGRVCPAGPLERAEFGSNGNVTIGEDGIIFAFWWVLRRQCKLEMGKETIISSK